MEDDVVVLRDGQDIYRIDLGIGPDCTIQFCGCLLACDRCTFTCPSHCP